MVVSRTRLSPKPGPDPLRAVAACLGAAGLASRARIRLALSGGVDSMVLLHLLHRLAPSRDFVLSACHVHHGLSPHADHWLAFCGQQCALLGVPFHGVEVTVDPAHPQGLEAAARQVRLHALAGAGADWLVFGHHLDDQAETLLFRLMRGTGLRGAGAMRQVERPPGDLPRIRPLLKLRRGAIEAWAKAEGIAWVEDESNADTRFARNHLRHRVLPQLEAARPGATVALGRAAEHFQEASDLLDELAGLDAAQCGGESWDRACFMDLSPARQRNLLRWRLRGWGCATPEAGRLAETLRQLQTSAGGAGLRLSLGALALCLFRDQIWLEPWDSGVPVPLAVDFSVAGPQVLPWGRGRVVLTPAVGEGVSLAALQGGPCRLMTRWPGLSLRTRPEGPRRSFKKLCQEGGVPPWQRDILPVLAVGREVAWVAGLGVGAGFTCASGALGVMPCWEQPIETSHRGAAFGR